MSEPENPSPPPVRYRWTLGAIAVFVMGLLILVPSGLCTAVFGFSMLTSGNDGLLLLPLVIGGVPIAIGILLVRAGLEMRKDD